MKSSLRIHPSHARTCGDCNACCTVMEVSELSKPSHVGCEHIASRGCEIYSERPAACSHFKCSWLAGFYNLTGSQRPDRMGVIVYTAPHPEFEVPAIFVAEVWAGASRELAVRLLVRELGRRGVPVMIVRKVEA